MVNKQRFAPYSMVAFSYEFLFLTCKSKKRAKNMEVNRKIGYNVNNIFLKPLFENSDTKN